MTNYKTQNDYRQRFFIDNSPVRGDVVHLSHSYAQVIAQKDYPPALQQLLGEMLVSASLLIGTLKINGRLSIQLQHANAKNTDNNPALHWAMAECDHLGQVRGLAEWSGDWINVHTANDAFATLGKVGEGVLFINIQPEQGDSYQGIVERMSDNLAECLAYYQRQSMQIPTLINLSCNGLEAGGILVQLLPRNSDDEQEFVDNDLFPRLTILTNTLKAEELTDLPANEILFRLYHEENVITADPVGLQFACTCSQEKCESAIFQLGKEQALQIVEQDGKIALDCGFCGKVYHFDNETVAKIFV